jgi:hypothetical protein
MIENLHFIHQEWLWPTIIGGVVVWLISVVLFWFSSERKRFIIKMIAAFFAIAALVLIALKPAVTQKQNEATAIMLTSGYDKSVLDSLQKAKENVLLLNYDPRMVLSKDLDSLTTIKIIGNGVKNYDFWQFKSISVNFLPGKVPNGIIALNYKKRPILGENLEIMGSFNNPEKGHRLVLQDPGGAGLDSVVLNKKKFDFQLGTSLKTAGKLVYRLIEKDSVGNELSENPIPVEVQPNKVFNVLIINDFPTFETKYLKDCLAEMGHKVLIRSKLTSNRYKFEYFNREQVPLSVFSQATLESFDLLIIDSQSLRNLPNSAKNGLEMAINQDGLGVFVQADITFFRGAEDLVSLKFNSDRNTTVRLDEFPRVALAKNSFVFEKTFGLETVQNSEAKIISAYKRDGKGRVGTTVLDKTYELLLDGKQDVYTKLWTELLSPLGKKEITETRWSAQNAVIYQDEPFTFNLYTNLTEPNVEVAEGDRIALKQDLDLPEKWEGRSYPNQRGWNRLSLAQDSTQGFNYFVDDSSHWKALSGYATMQQNKRFFNTENASVSRKIGLKPIDFWWFFAVFLMLMGFLWLEPKWDI